MRSGSPHIIVVGAGLIGLSTADALLALGGRVTIIEARDAPMRGASFANSGMIHPSQACQWAGPANNPAVDAAVLDLAMQSRDRLSARMAALGIEDLSGRDPGCYQIFATDRLAQAAYARLVERHIAVDRVEAGSLPVEQPALFFPEDRSGDAYRYGRVLLNDLLARGAAVNFGQTPVLERDESGAVRLMVQGTPLQADAIILACGADTPDLLKEVGLNIDITPVRGWAVDYTRPAGLTLTTAPIMDAQTRSALTLLDDVMRLSGTWAEDAPDLLINRWQVLLPDVFDKKMTPQRVWSGLRPVSSLGRPIIGPTPLPGLWMNAGHGHMGWTLCAGSGALMAKMVMQGETDPRFAFLGSC